MNPVLLYDSKLLTATLSSSTLKAGYNVQTIKDMRPYTFAMFNAAGTNYIQGWWGAATAVNCVGIAGHNFATVSAVVSIEHSTNGTDWTEAATLTPTANNTIIFSFASQTKAYWRVKVVNSSGLPFLAVAYFGVAILFDYPPSGPIIPFSENITAEENESETGNLLGINIKFNKTDISRMWGQQTKTFYDTYFKPFWDNHGKLLKPFFYADNLTARADEAHFVRLKKEMLNAPQYSRADIYDTIQLEMIGML